MMLSLGSHHSASCHPHCTACGDTFPAVLGFAAGNGELFKYICTLGIAIFSFVFHTDVILKAILSSLRLCILMLSLRSQQRHV